MSPGSSEGDLVTADPSSSATVSRVCEWVMKESLYCCSALSRGEPVVVARSCWLFGTDDRECGSLAALLLAELTEACLLFVNQDLVELNRAGVSLTTARTRGGLFVGSSKCKSRSVSNRPR